jgi:squalene-hopene/tetraprenyl-beta-curcumene cyclase
MKTSSVLLGESVQEAIFSSRAYLFSVLRSNGSWQDHVASSAVAVSTALCALHFADCQRFAEQVERGCAWLRQTQHEDGGWGDAITDRSSINATTISLAVLQIADPANSRAAVERALAYMERRGGLALVRDQKQCSMSVACQGYLALAGFYPWEAMTRVPLALRLLPSRLWMRFSITMPGIFGWALIEDHKLKPRLADRLLRQLALPRVIAWIREARGSNGSWEDSPLLTGIVLLGLILSGQPAELITPGVDYLLATQRENGSWAGEEDLELSVTTFILSALAELGELNHPRLAPTADWLLAAQHAEPFAPTGCPGGWWTWRQPSGWPDTDDTCGALASLRLLGVSAAHPQMLAGGDWLCKMQNTDGSWGMFVKDCHAPQDEPCPGLTSRVILALIACWRDPQLPEHTRERYGSAISRALENLQRVQHADGSLEAIWYKTRVYATALTLEMYHELAATPFARQIHQERADACRAWLLNHQREDGSWGDNPHEPGTVEETSWALCGLASPGVNAPQEALDLAAAWLVEQQHAEGHWRPSVIGYYARSLVYSSDHIANGFALRALARYQRQRAALVAPVSS